jgi:hypothetical protein
MNRHVNVSGEDRTQQRNQPPRSKALQPRDKQQYPQCDFDKVAQIHEKEMPRDIRRHHPHVEFLTSKMLQTCQDEENGEEVFQYECNSRHWVRSIILLGEAAMERLHTASGSHAAP